MPTPYFHKVWRYGFNSTAGDSAPSTGTPKTSTNVSSTEYAHGDGLVNSFTLYVESDTASSGTWNIETVPAGSTKVQTAHHLSTTTISTGSVVQEIFSSGAYFDVFPRLVTHSSGVITFTAIGYR